MQDAFAHCEALLRAADKDRFLTTLFAPAEHRDALFELYDEPMATLADLEAYADGASASLIALAAQILAAGGEPDIGALSHHAGLAHALAGLLAAFPIHAARGQLFIPLEMLARHGADRLDVKGGPATPQLRAALAELRLRARHHLGAAHQLLATAAPAVVP